MDLDFTADEQAFRSEVRAFVQKALPDGIRQKVLGGRHLDREETMGWHRTLAAHGWGAPTWPKEHGGTGITVLH